MIYIWSGDLRVSKLQGDIQDPAGGRQNGPMLSCGVRGIGVAAALAVLGALATVLGL